MKVKVIFLTLVLFSLGVGRATAQETGHPDQTTEQTTWRGFLVDARYAADLLSYENLAQKAKKYTKELGLKREAQESGYGVVVRDKFYAFDAKGNELALELLRKTNKVSRIEVEVAGVLPRGGDSGLVQSTTTTPKPGTPGRDRLGRPTYDQVPGQNTERSYGASATLSRRRGDAVEKILVESLKEVEPAGAKP